MQQNLLLVNKPKYWTSNDVVKKIKGILRVKKVGHAGTLDPLATGLLILGINDGTKCLSKLLLNDKTYIATIAFGYQTTTYDAEGEIVKTKDVIPNLVEIETALNSFKNSPYFQTPPAYSAIKINGKKAYELARANKEFVIEPREVSLHNFQILSYEGDKLVLELNVSKGFYVRSLAYDLGLKCNSLGTLINLNRTKIGSFKLSEALEIKDVYGYWFK